MVYSLNVWYHFLPFISSEAEKAEEAQDEDDMNGFQSDDDEDGSDREMADDDEGDDADSLKLQKLAAQVTELRDNLYHSCLYSGRVHLSILFLLVFCSLPSSPYAETLWCF